MSIESDNAIYTGFWVNWTYTQVRGATLTLNHRDAGFLTAFLALFVSIAGRSFWRLSCYIIHSKLSTGTSQDGLHNQRQVILRNAATDMIGIQLFVRLAWKWRNRAMGYRFRLFPIIAFTALTAATFYAGSIFSSQVCFETH